MHRDVTKGAFLVHSCYYYTVSLALWCTVSQGFMKEYMYGRRRWVCIGDVLFLGPGFTCGVGEETNNLCLYCETNGLIVFLLRVLLTILTVPSSPLLA